MNQMIGDQQEDPNSLSNLKHKGVNISKGNDSRPACQFTHNMATKKKSHDNIIETPSEPAHVQILLSSHLPKKEDPQSTASRCVSSAPLSPSHAANDSSFTYILYFKSFTYVFSHNSNT